MNPHHHLSRQEQEEEHGRVARAILDSVYEERVAQDTLLRGILDAHIDEMSLLFPDEMTLGAFVRYAVREEGYELFNSASSHVRTGPISSHYEASYWFLTTPGYVPGVTGYRLELMSLFGHGSPLHDRLMALLPAEGFRCRMVHASFKCADEEDYATAVRAFGHAGYELVQRCHSEYGTFSYWKHYSHEGVPVTYLKARVNQRDQRNGEEA